MNYARRLAGNLLIAGGIIGFFVAAIIAAAIWLVR